MRISGSKQRGFSLVTMLVVVVIVGGVASGFMLLSTTEARTVETNRYKQRATYLAEAAAEDVANLLRSMYAAEQLPPYANTSKFFPRGASDSGTHTFGGRTYNYRWIQVDKSVGTAEETSREYNRLELSGTVVIDASHNIAPLTFTATQYSHINPPVVTGSLSTARMFYDIEVTCRYNRALGHLNRVVEVKSTPLFQFLAFFNGDLEFLPGPPFVGHGRVHTNGDLYIGANSSIDLYTDHVQAYGQMYRHRKDAPATVPGGPLVMHRPDGSGGTSTWLTGAAWESAVDGGANPANTTPNSNWPTQSADLQNFGVKNSATGASRIEPPPIGAIDPPSAYTPNGGPFFEKANSNGLVIRDTEVVRWDGATSSWAVDAAATSALQSSGALTVSQVADNRENASSHTPVTVVDMEKLKATSYYPYGGVLYAFRSGNGSADSSGNYARPAVLEAVVFKNGSDLMPASGAMGGLTIASNGPVYIEGDFNAPRVSDGMGGYLKNTNTADPLFDSPLQNDSRKIAAAVIADAVNLLSNNWNNSKTPGGGLTGAAPTNYNFAMVTGNVPTPDGGGAYSGGLENLPRFHEDWNYTNSVAGAPAKRSCNFKGAMVNLWKSRLATERWGKGGVYDPPHRNWDFDSDFTDPNKAKPPAFPTGVEIGRTVYEEDYRR